MDDRKVWLRNVPLAMTEELIIQHLRDQAAPVPRSVVRKGASQNAAFCIATFDTADDAQSFLGLQLCWPGDRHIVSRQFETEEYMTKRKSAAYHFAMERATLAGKSNDEARADARKAYAAMD